MEGGGSLPNVGITANTPWCAAFATGCARAAKLDSIIPWTASSSYCVRSGRDRRLGVWIPGPNHGNVVTPQPGDYILIRWSAKRYIDEIDSDHIGIVKSVPKIGNCFTTIEGNRGNAPSTATTVQECSWSLSDTRINGYYRPDWSRVGLAVDDLEYAKYMYQYNQDAPGYMLSKQSLYTSVSDENDAILRRVGYIDTTYEPSIKPSNIELSCINYTSVLGSLFYYWSTLNSPQQSQQAAAQYSADTYTGNVESVPREIIQFFHQHGFPYSAGCGIASNVFHECSYNIGLIAEDTGGIDSYGMCMWYNAVTLSVNGRKIPHGTYMTQVVPNWRTNLTGQCQFLLAELSGKLSPVYSQIISNTNRRCRERYNVDLIDYLKSRPNTPEGASQAAQAFGVCYEVYEGSIYETPTNPSAQTKKRMEYANNLFNRLIKLKSQEA